MNDQRQQPDEQIATPMVYYRGGTSKAVIIDRRHLPVRTSSRSQPGSWPPAARRTGARSTAWAAQTR